MTPIKKTLIFECYNLIDPMEWGAVTFWGWCSINKLSNPMVI
jgi:hypothetical protein